MCGLTWLIQHSSGDAEVDDSPTGNRGPDAHETHRINTDSLNISICGHVLHMRGLLTLQPRQTTSVVLSYNGEIYDGLALGDGSNDTAALADKLEHIITSEYDSSAVYATAITTFLSSLRGPWSMVFYDQRRQRLWMGRDYFGRRSLCLTTSAERLVISSCVCPQIQAGSWQELTAACIFQFDVSGTANLADAAINLYPWQFLPCTNSPGFAKVLNTQKAEHAEQWCQDTFGRPGVVAGAIIAPVAPLNLTLPDVNAPSIVAASGGMPPLTAPFDAAQLIGHCRFTSLDGDGNLDETATELLAFLQAAVKKRACQFHRVVEDELHHLPVGVLFSGGVDCMLLAALLDRCLPASIPIELFNVAFENHARQRRNADDVFSVPDRVTGVEGYEELRNIAPAREWRLCLLNVTQDELNEHRPRIHGLVAPLESQLDESIGCAIWFAARAKGIRYAPDESVHMAAYTGVAKVLLLGMGADEQFAGYARHRTAYEKHGWLGALCQVEQDVRRISTRNLGRDDRVVGDHAREGRYPFLDEDVVDYVSRLPLHVKADFTAPRGLGEKKLLRRCAELVGLPVAAQQPKRAIQFGSRIAKMERASKVIGSDNFKAAKSYSQ